MSRDQSDRLAALTALSRLDLTEAWAELAAAFAVFEASVDDVPTGALNLHIDKLQRDATAALGRGDKRHYKKAMQDLAVAKRQLARRAR